MFLLYEHVRIHYASNNHTRPWILATVLALIHTIPYEFMYNLPLLLSPSHLNYANVCRLQCISIKAYARSLIFPWHGVPSRPALYYPWFIQDMLHPHSDSNHQNLGLKMLVRYMMPSVCLRLRQFSQLSLYSLYGAVCLQLTQFCDDRENVYFLLLSSSNRKYESLTIV